MILYLSPEESNPGDASINFIIELSRHCGFHKNGENAILLSRILGEKNTGRIESYLRANEIPFNKEEEVNTDTEDAEGQSGKLDS